MTLHLFSLFSQIKLLTCNDYFIYFLSSHEVDFLFFQYHDLSPGYLAGRGQQDLDYPQPSQLKFLVCTLVVLEKRQMALWELGNWMEEYGPSWFGFGESLIPELVLSSAGQEILPTAKHGTYRFFNQYYSWKGL